MELGGSLGNHGADVTNLVELEDVSGPDIAVSNAHQMALYFVQDMLQSMKIVQSDHVQVIMVFRMYKHNNCENNTFCLREVGQ